MGICESDHLAVHSLVEVAAVKPYRVAGENDISRNLRGLELQVFIDIILCLDAESTGKNQQNCRGYLSHIPWVLFAETLGLLLDESFVVEIINPHRFFHLVKSGLRGLFGSLAAFLEDIID